MSTIQINTKQHISITLKEKEKALGNYIWNPISVETCIEQCSNYYYKTRGKWQK